MKSLMPSKRSTGVFATLPLFLGILGLTSLTSLTMANPAMAEQQQMLRTLTVTGQGTEMVPTTLSRVQLGVEVQGDTAEKVQQEAARRSSAVVELVRSRNVAKLQTTGISLNPRYDYSNNGEQKIVGYTATNSISFQVPTDRAGTIMDDAVKAGATRIDGVSFIADEGAIATAQRQAIREATQDAQAQADAALSALGLTRKEVVSIQVNGSTPPPPILYQREALAARAADSQPPTPVVGGEQEVQTSVTLQFSY
jgi:uncharacterized protein